MSDLRQQIREHYDAQSLSTEKVEAILARGQAAAQGEEIAPESPKVVALPQPSGRGWRTMLAWAAVLLVVAGLAWFNVRDTSRVPFAVLTPRIVEFFGKLPELPERSQDKTELRAWLVAQGAPAEMKIPKGLMTRESLGCQVVDVKGRPAWLTCFWMRKEAGSLVHLWVVRRQDFRDGPNSPQPQMREHDGWSFASWSEGDVIYTMAFNGPMNRLTPLLAAKFASPAWPLALLGFPSR